MKTFIPDHDTAAYNFGKSQDYNGMDDYIAKHRIKDMETLHDICRFFDRGLNGEDMYDE